MKLFFFVTVGLCIPIVATAQVATSDGCLMLEKSGERLACYDKYFNYRSKESSKRKRSAIEWKVRDSKTISPVRFADVGTGPGLILGGDTRMAKIAVIGAARPVNQPGFFEGWEPIVGVSWNKDLTGDKPKDLRQVLVGISGQVGTPKREGVSAFSTLRLGYKHDIKKRTQGILTNLHADIIYLPWVNSPIVAGSNFMALVPYAGYFSEVSHSSPAEPEDGTFMGIYAGAKLEAKLDAIFERLSLMAQFQHYRHVSVPDAANKQTLCFTSIGFSYNLFDPDVKGGWVASLNFSWQRGTEPVTGEGPGLKRIIGLGIKYD